MKPVTRHDRLIVGSGPAGSTAATHLARFRRRVMVVDGGASRASWSPVSRDPPGLPDGVPGPESLDRMRTQAPRYGTRIVPGRVERLEGPPDGGCAAAVGGRRIEAERVPLATGGPDVGPEAPGLRDAARHGLVHDCPVRDADEVTGQEVALTARGECRGEKALLPHAVHSRPHGAHVRARARGHAPRSCGAP